jgi:hypothetical protein
VLSATELRWAWHRNVDAADAPPADVLLLQKPPPEAGCAPPVAAA